MLVSAVVFSFAGGGIVLGTARNIRGSFLHHCRSEGHELRREKSIYGPMKKILSRPHVFVRREANVELSSRARFLSPFARRSVSIPRTDFLKVSIFETLSKSFAFSVEGIMRVPMIVPIARYLRIAIATSYRVDYEGVSEIEERRLSTRNDTRSEILKIYKLRHMFFSLSHQICLSQREREREI